MKRYIFVILGIAMLGVSAHAVQKCVALDASGMQGSSLDYESYQPDWSVTFTNGVTVKGIGVCSNKSGSYKETSDSITFDDTGTPDNNYYCWCRMISPAVSSWVFSDDAGYADHCAFYCSNYCALSVWSSSAFRSALFSGLGN